MNGKQVGLLASVGLAVCGVAWACSVGSQVVYGAAPGSANNVLQAILGLVTGGGGIISTLWIVLKKFVPSAPDGALVAVEKMLADYRAGKMIDVAEDTVLTSALLFRVKEKDARGIEIATSLIQHVMVELPKGATK